MPWTRREALRLGSAVVPLSLAGCSGIFDDSEPKARALGESQTSNGTTVTVTDVVAQGSFLRTLVDPFWEPVSLGFDKYLFARVEVAGKSPPSPDDFRFFFHGPGNQDETVRGTANPEVSPSQQIYEREPRYKPDEGIWSGWIAFVGDIVTAKDAYIEWENNRWALPDSDWAALKDGFPAFEYGTIEVPEQISSGESLEVNVELKNVNDSYTGVCRGGLHVLQPRPQTVTPADTAQLFQVSIEPGQTATWTTTFESDFIQSVSHLQLLLKSHAGDRELTVDVTQ